MSDLNDLSRPVLTDTEPNVLDTLRAHIVRAATWAGYATTANKVAGIMSGVTASVSGGRSLRLYRRNDANTTDEEVVTLPGISVGGNAGTASAAQAGGALQTALDAKAPLASPALTGTPTAPTAAAGTATTQVANTAFVATAVANVVNSSPAALDTLNELATALGNDPNFASSTATALGNRVTKTSAARPGVTKLYRSDADDAYNVQTWWAADRLGYWSLRGYNGDTYHAPVFVGYAGQADAVPWSGVSGKPNTVAGYGITDMGSQSVNYANSSGNAASASTVTNVTTAQVLAATAGASAGGVGSYAFAKIASHAAYDSSFGATRPGNDLVPTSAAGGVSGNPSLVFADGASLTGTWRCMGYGDYEVSNNAGAYMVGVTLWLRIA